MRSIPAAKRLFILIAFTFAFCCATAAFAMPQACGPSGNAGPQAVDDHVTWQPGTFLVDVLKNDYDPDDANHADLHVTSVTGVTSGATATIGPNGQSVSFAAPAGSTSQFTYTVADLQGATDTATAFIGAAPPTTNFDAKCNNTVCTFTAQPSKLDGIHDFTWSFACPNGPSCSSQVTWNGFLYFKTMPAFGQWQVSLSVNYYNGDVATSSRAVTLVQNPPHVEFDTDPGDSAPSDLDMWIVFTKSDLDPASLCTGDLSIDWGDGVVDHPGLDCQHNLVGRRLHHYPGYHAAGIYKITALVTNASGVLGTYSRQLELVNEAPIAVITAVQNTGDANLWTLSAEMSYDDAPPLALEEWDYGDGTSESFDKNLGSPHAHRFAKPGNQLVTLKVTDGMGSTGAITKTVSVPNRAPVASVFARCDQLDCTFSGIDSTDDAEVRSYTWTVEGQTFTSEIPTMSYRFQAPGRYPVTMTASDGALTSPPATHYADARSDGPPRPYGYFAIVPCRAFDSGVGIPSGSTRTIDLSACLAGVNASVVELDATVASATQTGNLRLFSTAATAPVSTFLNFTPDVPARTNNGAVPASPAGTISALLTMPSSGTGRLIVDVIGYYSSDVSAPAPIIGPLSYQPRPQERIYDSRLFGAHLTDTQPIKTAYFPQFTQAPVMVLNTTIVGSTANGYLWSYPADLTSPRLASTFNFTAGRALSNSVIARLGIKDYPGSGAVTFSYGPAAKPASADIIIDQSGAFVPASAGYGGAYVAVEPCRLADTRVPAYGYARLRAGEMRQMYVRGNCGVRLDAYAYRLNFTVTGAAGAGRLMVSDAYEVPTTSRMNYLANETIANGVIVGTMQGEDDFIVTASTDADLIVDVVGYYTSSAP